MLRSPNLAPLYRILPAASVPVEAPTHALRAAAAFFFFPGDLAAFLAPCAAYRCITWLLLCKLRNILNGEG